MGIVSGLTVFLITWWVVLFAVLPWGNRAPDSPGKGHEAGAPERPRLVMKMLITTAITVVIWIGVDLLVMSDAISFRGALTTPQL